MVFYRSGVLWRGISRGVGVWTRGSSRFVRGPTVPALAIYRSRYAPEFSWGGAAAAGLGVFLAASLAAPPRPVVEAKSATEPSPGHADDDAGEVSGPAELGGRRKIGGGYRHMTPLRIKVYTIGVYVQEAGEEVIARLAKADGAEEWMGASAETLMGQERFWLELLDRGGEMTMLMRVVRPVAGKHMQHGFDRGLLKRVRRAAKEMDMPGGKKALKKFNKLFTDMGTLPAGTRVELTFRDSGNALHVRINDKDAALIENRALCWALWDMFLAHSSPASPEVKKSVAQGLATLLAVTTTPDTAPN